MRVCMDAERRCKRRELALELVAAVEPGPAVEEERVTLRLPRPGALGLGEELVLPLAVRVLRGDMPGPYWWWRAPDEGARGLGRRRLSARVGRWLGSLWRTAEGTPVGCGMWIIIPLVAKLLVSSVSGGAGYSKLC